MRRIARYVAYLLAGLTGLAAILFVAAILIGVIVFETTVPDYDGVDRIPQLAADVTIIRDTNAVPHIFAEGPLDAYRALGYVHAQDRFFQMEMARRIGAGRLSEIIGATGLRSDRFMRTLGIGRLADVSVERVDPATRKALDAYSEGVNAWLQSPETKRPPELILLGIKPEPWRSADSAVWSRLMALLLSGNWTEEMLRAQLATQLTPQQIIDLWPGEPADGPTTVASLERPAQRIDFAAIAQAVPNFLLQASASNEWVVSGDRSTTGKPFLANDPHLGFRAPGMWYLARIVTPTFAGAGATFPGQPFFAIGHNNHLAWGFTSTHADTQDLFLENLNPDDPSQYLTPDGALPFETREEVIRVRFRRAPQKIKVRSTRHGPVVSDISAMAETVAELDPILALSFPALREDDRTVDALFQMNRATTHDALMSALALFHSPVQNIVYAFTNGDTGFVMAGRVPIRQDGDGRGPQDGQAGEQDWTGFIPFEELPQRHNPAVGWIANANNRVVGDDYPYLITPDWQEGYRAARIEELLAQTSRHSADSFAAIQNDIVSPVAQELLPLLLSRLTPPPNDTGQTAAGLLHQWDGTMGQSQPQPLIFTAWLQALGDHLYGDEAAALTPRNRMRPRLIQHLLTKRAGWCNNIDTPVDEDCSTIVSAAFVDALDELTETWGNDPTIWRWGDAHIARFAHPLLGRVPLLRDLTTVTIPTGGGDFTVSRGTSRRTSMSAFTHVHGAGLRTIFDLSDLANSRLAIATGQSGHLRSEFYADTLADWRDGQYLMLKGDPATLRKTAAGELTLQP